MPVQQKTSGNMSEQCSSTTARPCKLEALQSHPRLLKLSAWTAPPQLGTRQYVSYTWSSWRKVTPPIAHYRHGLTERTSLTGNELSAGPNSNKRKCVHAVFSLLATSYALRQG